jgi:molybdenum cofactor biosynthesis protein B
MAAHAHHHHDARSVTCAVITVSDSRTEENDTSGQLIRRLLCEAGHAIELYRIVRDEPRLIVDVLRSVPKTTQAIICNGGTGLAKRDSTYEAISGLLEKEISGFGELFRMLSYQQIGAAAILSRATAGVAGGRILFSLPGSSAAVELAMTKLILPELGHMVGLVRDSEG